MKTSKKYLLWLLVSFIVAGAIEGVFAEISEKTNSIAFGHTIIIAILVFSWCKSHAFENGIQSVGGFRLLAAAIPPVGVPIYFFKYFGFKAGGLLTLKATGFLVILILSYLVPYVLLFNISL